MTAWTMQSVAERTSGSVAAIFACMERWAGSPALLSGSVATARSNVVPTSGASSMRDIPYPRNIQLAGPLDDGQLFMFSVGLFRSPPRVLSFCPVAVLYSVQRTYGVRS